MTNLTMASMGMEYEKWYGDSLGHWGTIRLGKEEKLEAIQQPESFILTCEYCGTSHRVKDDFSCQACGAPFNMKKVTALPMMVHKTDLSELDADKLYSMATQSNGLMSKAEARRRFLGIEYG